jgi:uncharacterized protein YndB with AHSA1/START domain
VEAEGRVAVTREVRIEARPETVFRFLTEPELLMRWKGVEASCTPELGGVFRVNVTGTAVVVGEFVEVDPPRRVVFTWGWEGDPAVPPGSTTVEVVLRADGESTLVTLTHRDLPPGAEGAHVEGWEHYLPRLAVAAGGGDPGPDPWVEGGA